MKLISLLILLAIARILTACVDENPHRVTDDDLKRAREDAHGRFESAPIGGGYGNASRDAN